MSIYLSLIYSKFFKFLSFLSLLVQFVYKLIDFLNFMINVLIHVDHKTAQKITHKNSSYSYKVRNARCKKFYTMLLTLTVYYTLYIQLYRSRSKHECESKYHSCIPKYSRCCMRELFSFELLFSSILYTFAGEVGMRSAFGPLATKEG